jgi:hypothetical protein
VEASPLQSGRRELVFPTLSVSRLQHRPCVRLQHNAWRGAVARRVTAETHLARARAATADPAASTEVSHLALALELAVDAESRAVGELFSRITDLMGRFNGTAWTAAHERPGAIIADSSIMTVLPGAATAAGAASGGAAATSGKKEKKEKGGGHKGSAAEAAAATAGDDYDRNILSTSHFAELAEVLGAILDIGSAPQLALALALMPQVRSRRASLDT